MRTSLRRAEVPTKTDQRLVQSVLDGDRSAFSDLLGRHDARLRGLAYKLLAGDRDRMDDALQEAYIRAYGGLARFRAEADFGTWMYRIVYNACVDELRRGRRRPEPFDTSSWDEEPSRRSGPEAAVAAADQVLRALAALPDEQRMTVVLVDGEGFDHQQAADILGVAPGTVASRLSRARATMRQLLEADEEDQR